MSKEEIYNDVNGKGYMKITYAKVEIPDPPKTLDEAIQRIKDLFEFDQNETLMNKLIEDVKNNWNKMRREEIQAELITLLEGQVADLVMMSKIELGDDVIAEINRLKGLLNNENDGNNRK